VATAVGGMGMVEAMEEVAGAIMGDTLTAMAITGDMVGRVTLIGGIIVPIPIITIPVGAGVLDAGHICPLRGQGFGCPAGGFHATKSRAFVTNRRFGLTEVLRNEN